MVQSSQYQICWEEEHPSLGINPPSVYSTLGLNSIHTLIVKRFSLNAKIIMQVINLIIITLCFSYPRAHNLLPKRKIN